MPSFAHVNVKHLPQIPDQASRRSLFLAIDHARRWIYLQVRNTKSTKPAHGFLKELLEKAPFHITHLVTDNGKEFTDHFAASGERQPTGHHPLDPLYAEHGTEPRLIRPKRPQTNGMVERFNGALPICCGRATSIPFNICKTPCDCTTACTTITPSRRRVDTGCR